jgi:large conductance mechanosensitive channel
VPKIDGNQAPGADGGRVMPDNTEKQSLATELREFLTRGNVVDLAVAVVIGAAFSAVVNALVKDLLTPIVAAIIGKPDFSKLTFTIHKSQFFYGDFLNAVITFVSVALAVFFFVVKPLNVMASRRKRQVADGEEPAVLSDEAVLLTEIRDLLRSQRAS